jgi:hypothetical protein
MQTIQSSSRLTSFAIPFIFQSFIFLAYVGVFLFSLSRHELWGDEIHSWNISKGSASLQNLFQNMRYEGHPPLWYIFLFSISRFSHNPIWIQVVHALFPISLVFLICYFSPFPFFAKALIPFGYYFVFEYSVLSRNYALGILISIALCLILTKPNKYKIYLLYFLIFLLSNTHLLGLILGISFGFYLAYEHFEETKNIPSALWKIFIGVFLVMPALYFIVPPSDSEMNFSFWLESWSMSQFLIIGQIPVKSFFTIPVWWSNNFWNTNVLIDLSKNNSLMRVVALLFSVGILFSIYYVLRKNTKVLVFFGCNFLLTCLAALLFPFTSTRYVGFIYIAFIISMWLYLNRNPLEFRQKFIVVVFLVFQAVGALVALRKDWELPFSNSNRVSDLYGRIPKNDMIITDYWCLNNLSAFVDKPFYCVGLKREIGFVLWNRELANVSNQSGLYSTEVKQLINERLLKRLYLISTNDLKSLESLDPSLITNFKVTNISSWVGAIERSSNVYLYSIEIKNSFER